MKLKKLLTLLPVLALTACGSGKPLTTAELIETAGGIRAAQQSIETPTEFMNVYTVTQTDDYGEGVETFNLKQVLALKGNAMYFEQTANGEVLKVWSYVDGNTWYIALDDGVNKMYMPTEIPEGQYVPVEGLDAGLASIFGEETMMPDFFCSLLLEEESINNVFQYEDPAVAAAEGFVSIKLHANSKGEGHLSYGIEAEMGPVETLGMEGTIKEEYEWNNYLLVSYTSFMHTEMPASEEITYISEVSEKETFKYSGVSIKLPKISEFTLAE